MHTRPLVPPKRASRAPARLGAALVVVSVALGGCGFKLRGTVDLPFETVYVSGMEFSPFTGQLRRGIASGSRTRLARNEASAQATVQLLGELQERQILALSGGGRVRELQLRYHVKFRVSGQGGKEWLPTSDVLVVRDMTYDDAQVLAKEGEAQILFKDMQNDAVQQVLRRIQSIRGVTEIDG